MEIYVGNYSLFRSALFLIITSTHCAVQGGIVNVQSPVTIQDDLYKFIEATKGTSKWQSPSTIQQDVLSFISNIGEAAELQSSFSRPAIQVESSYVPSQKPQGESNEKNNTWERHKRSFQYRDKIFNVPEPFNTKIHFDQDRPTSTIPFNFGMLDRIPRNGQPQVILRPKELTNFDFRLQGDISAHTDRPQTFFRSQKHSHVSSRLQERPNPFLNQPVFQNQNPKFPNTRHSFIAHNEKPIFNLPHNKFHNSGILSPAKSTSNFHGHSRPFSISNNRPKHTKVNTNSQVTLSSPETDHDLAFSRPNKRPSVDFSSIFGKPVTSAVSVAETNDDKTGIKTIRQFTRPSVSGTGCRSPSGLRRPREVWYSTGCRRSKCINFRGTTFIETDQCDTEIYNTVYKCIIEVDIKANFPGCCPRYRCNPDNLGNLVE